MRKILIVDDDPSIRSLVTGILIDEGFSVGVAGGGSAALEMMMREPPDLILLDIMMPGMDGYAVLKEMKVNGLRDACKVIVFTAKNSESDLLRGYRLGADHFLPKPFDLDELVRSVHEVLSLSDHELARKRTEELDRAKLLSRLESLLDS